ncbi:carbohydrate-binding protein [Salinigranum sp. GCM10025319]|uniref:carbohydrate-binding protein n=1 Tax=Salinigranum sp. GCM10025319 TaxID=3252687 RepID=UPI003620E601
MSDGNDADVQTTRRTLLKLSGLGLASLAGCTGAAPDQPPSIPFGYGGVPATHARTVVEGDFQAKQTTNGKQAPRGRRIPGRVEVEEYDTGGEGVAYHDTTRGNWGGIYRSDDVDIRETTDRDGDYEVGWIEDGEWLEYAVNVKAGRYDVRVRAASWAEGNEVRVVLGGLTLGTVTLPNTGAEDEWTTATLSGVSVPKGRLTLRLEMIGGSFALNWVEFDRTRKGTETPTPEPTETPTPTPTPTPEPTETPTPTPTPTPEPTETPTPTPTPTPEPTETPTPTPVPTETPTPVEQAPMGGAAWNATQRVEAEDYDVGGEGVAYHDTDETNHGGAYRKDGVDIQATDDDDGGYNVGWTRPDEWLEYTVDIEAGTYDFRARLASLDGGGALRVSLDGTSLGRIDVPATGDYQTYETAVLQDVTVPSSGEQVLRLDVEGGYFTINWVRFARLEPIVVDEYEYGEHTYGTHGFGE